MARRIIWQLPREELAGTYPEGRPRFDPFPTVTEVVMAAFCPRAAYHHILHALDPFEPWGRKGGWPRGEGYHRMICLLEQAMARGEELTWPKVDGMGTEVLGAEWDYVKPNVEEWWEKVRPERRIGVGEELFFELTVAGEVRAEGISNLHLRGKVDEIDKTKRLIVERTSKGRELALAQMKDFQLWLLHQILKGIRDEDRPEELRGEDLGSYGLILETPNEIIPVREKPEYRSRLHSALFWIRGITMTEEKSSLTVSRSVLEASRRGCQPRNMKKGCELSHFCFQRSFAHPPGEVRWRMRVELAQKWRSLRWETMWEHDLYEYRLVLMPRRELQDKGMVCQARVVERLPTPRGLEVVVELPSPEEAREVEAEARPLRGILTLLYGTLRMGLREKGEVKGVEGSRVRLLFEGVVGHRLPEQILFVSTPSALILTEEEPIYLERGTQRDVYIYTTRGTDRESRAKKGGQFALPEALFGRRRVKEG